QDNRDISTAAWQRIARAFATAFKLKFAYQASTYWAYPAQPTDSIKWSSVESTASLDKYWKVYRHRLPSASRVTDELRAQWEEALDQNSRLAIIDPDNLGPGDFINPESNGQVFDPGSPDLTTNTYTELNNAYLIYNYRLTQINSTWPGIINGYSGYINQVI